GHWSVRDSNGLLAKTGCLIIAAGPLTADFVPVLRPATARVLGQVDFIRRADSGPALTFGSYLSPSVAGEDGELIAALGATFNREAGFRRGKAIPQTSETATNFHLLSERLFGHQAEPAATPPWAAWRLTTRDRLPFVGGMGKGRFIMTGLGSRGFTYAPLLADMLAAAITGTPVPVRRDIADAIAPNRFAHLV
ncbi:MAG: FAD-dependent oxidoreductase, partial [Rhodospirillales bacterium]